MNKKVIIIGAGGHSKVISEIIEQNGDVVLGYLDDKAKGNNIIGKICDTKKIFKKNDSVEFIIAIGNNEIRNKIFNSYDVKYYTAIHKSATVSKSAKIGEGTAIMAGVIINSNCSIGRNCIINTASVIEHDCLIKERSPLVIQSYSWCKK